MAVADRRTFETSQASGPWPPSSHHPLAPGPAILDDVPVLQNVVSTVNLGCTLDLKAIAIRARNTEYNPEKSAALIMRIKEPKATAILFSAGKLLCTGAKTEQLSLVAARKFARIVQKLGYDVKFKGFKIMNLVASYNLASPLSLTRLGSSHSEFSLYEPELFPGLIYRMKQLPKVMVMVFASGKIVIAGAQKRDEILKAFEDIHPVLMSFRTDKGFWRKS